MIGIIVTDPPCAPNLIQEVCNIRQSASPGLVRQSQKLDAVIDIKLPDNRDLTSILSRVIDDKLSDGSSQFLYTRCRMNLAVDFVQTQIPHFVDLGLVTINAWYEGSGLSTPATIILRPMDDAHWSR